MKNKEIKMIKQLLDKIEEFLRDRPYQKELVDDIIKNLKSRKMGSY